MPWLKWAANEVKQVVILEEGAHQRLMHWLQGSGIDCHGPMCKLCELGARASVRWSIETNTENGRFTWEMANMTWVDLNTIAGLGGGLLGLRLQVKRTGTGRDTRYTLVAQGHDESVKVADPARPVWADQPVEQAYTGTNGPTRAQVLADPEGAAAVVKELCRHLGVEPKADLARWLKAGGKMYASADAAGQLAGYTQHLERRVNALPPEEEPGLVEIDLGKLLG